MQVKPQHDGGPLLDAHKQHSEGKVHQIIQKNHF